MREYALRVHAKLCCDRVHTYKVPFRGDSVLESFRIGKISCHPHHGRGYNPDEPFDRMGRSSRMPRDELGEGWATRESRWEVWRSQRASWWTTEGVPEAVWSSKTTQNRQIAFKGPRSLANAFSETGDSDVTLTPPDASWGILCDSRGYS